MDSRLCRVLLSINLVSNLLLSLGVLPRALLAAQQPPPKIYVNGPIITMDPAQPQAEALVVQGTNIAFVGTAAEAWRWCGQAVDKGLCERVDLAGRPLLPGFIEAHGHLVGLGRSQMILDLRGATREETIVAKVAAKVQTLPAGQWVLGRGWDQNLWPTQQFPTHHALSAASPQHPVRLTRVDGHAAWYNLAALSLAGISRQTPDPIGGRIVRDAAGEPTGVLIDTAMALIDRYIPAPRPQEDRQALALAFQKLLASGVTSFHDAGVGRQALALYREMAEAGQLPVRIYALLDGHDDTLSSEHYERGPELGLAGGFLTIRGIKLMADGALGSRGAALLEAYTDEPKQHGSLLLSREQLQARVDRAVKAGFQVATHAIGDRAARLVLDVYAEAMREQGQGSALRLRMEHAQVVHPVDVPRFKTLGVIASMQPIHYEADHLWALTRLGHKRMHERAYPWRPLLKAGAPLAFGSDAPVEALDPLLGIAAAVQRTPTAQALSLTEAFMAYTQGGAYAEFSEQHKGRLKAGYLADLVVLNDNLFRPQATAANQTFVWQTVVAGQLAYQAPTAK